MGGIRYDDVVEHGDWFEYRCKKCNGEGKYRGVSWFGLGKPFERKCYVCNGTGRARGSGHAWTA
jgi:DnaJ-class molecular chaperone